ncbi:hypothetical protein HYW76_01835 [Candidatus Pacearchaeota archaeon]|nr:hypothetical protein [Candidatus Pacearchaeota archaeon]
MQKRASLVLSEVIFILLNLIFFIGMFYFIYRVGSSDNLYEQQFAKRIAILIDQGKTGTSIEIDISDMMKRAEKNKFNGKIIEVDKDKNKVKAKVNTISGYAVDFFSDAKVEVLENREKRVLILNIMEKE